MNATRSRAASAPSRVRWSTFNVAWKVVRTPSARAPSATTWTPADSQKARLSERDYAREVVDAHRAKVGESREWRRLQISSAEPPGSSPLDGGRPLPGQPRGVEPEDVADNRDHHSALSRNGKSDVAARSTRRGIESRCQRA